MGLPTITVIGNMKRIEYKQLPSGKALCKFQVECAEKNQRGEWTNLYLSGECWEKSAEFVNQYFRDGSPAIVTGKLYTNVYVKQDGSKAYENKLLFPNVSFAPKDKSDNQGGNNAPEQGQQPSYQKQEPHCGYGNPNKKEESSSSVPVIDIDEDEIPF